MQKFLVLFGILHFDGGHAFMESDKRPVALLNLFGMNAVNGLDFLSVCLSCFSKGVDQGGRRSAAHEDGEYHNGDEDSRDVPVVSDQ